MSEPPASPASPGAPEAGDILRRKAECRAWGRENRQQMPGSIRRWKDSHIAKRVVEDSQVAAAKSICLYHSLQEEVGTHQLITACLERGQQVTLPCYARQPVIRRITDPEKDLVPGSLSILEPKPHCLEVDPESIDVFLIPGIAFDRRCHRVGFGSGYYDRLLPRNRKGKLIAALAYDCQMLPEVPFDPTHDQPVDRIYTETGIYAYRRSETTIRDLAETQKLATQLAEALPERLRIGMEGPLGVGKTTLIRSLLEALGVQGPITSPSFVLMNEYQGRIPIRHLDLYRLGEGQLSEEDSEMFQETLGEFPGIVLLEWANYAKRWLPLQTARMHIDFLQEEQRRIILETFRQEDQSLHKVFQK